MRNGDRAASGIPSFHPVTLMRLAFKHDLHAAMNNIRDEIDLLAVKAPPV